MFYSVCPPSVTSLMPAQPPKASPEAAPHCSRCCVACVVCGELPSPACCCSASPGCRSVQTLYSAHCSFPAPYSWSAVKGASDDINWFLVIPQETLMDIMQGRRVLGLISSGLGWGNVEIWLFADHTLHGRFVSMKAFFLKSAGDQLPNSRYNLSMDAVLEDDQIEIRYQPRSTINFHKFSILSAGPGLIFWISAAQNTSSPIHVGIAVLMSGHRTNREETG